MHRSREQVVSSIEVKYLECITSTAAKLSVLLMAGIVPTHKQLILGREPAQYPRLYSSSGNVEERSHHPGLDSGTIIVETGAKPHVGRRYGWFR